jgi:hypothetical protein
MGRNHGDSRTLFINMERSHAATVAGKRAGFRLA